MTREELYTFFVLHSESANSCCVLLSSLLYLGLADNRFPVVAGNVVELDSVLVEVVEHAETTLIALPVVGLRASSSAHAHKFQL